MLIALSIPSPIQGVWELGPVPIRAYALCIIAGIVVAPLIERDPTIRPAEGSRATSAISPSGRCRSGSSAAGSTT